ncbi:MAG: hypothetical protein BGP21_02455 [Thiobacillus sp. 65-29]|nr:MAG: hypothetical protein BGP21_02455 [Thiobacillus sp. 65-29]
MRFWDSSAILPLLVEEASTPSALSYYENHPEIVAWWGTPVECASALARLEREASLDSADVTHALGQLTALQAAWHEVQPLDNVRQIAQRLLRLHPLRAADSLQLAAALLVCEHRASGWQFVCLDKRLSLAAEREGFMVVQNFVD